MFLQNLAHPVITDNNKRKMDRVLDSDEILLAIKQLHGNRSPGQDGLTIEFYKTYQEKLVPILYHVYYEAFNSKLHDSARRGIITLIEKSGKDPLELKNWRPLSLLNVDYKIIAKVISNRMQESLSYLIKKINLDSSNPGI